MGLKVKFWDISLHTVPEVEYDGRWHMYDNSLSAIYTLCDGKTIAGVEDIGADGACAASQRQDGARPHGPLPLPQRHQPQRLLDRMRHAPQRGRGVPAVSTRGG